MIEEEAAAEDETDDETELSMLLEETMSEEALALADTLEAIDEDWASDAELDGIWAEDELMVSLETEAEAEAEAEAGADAELEIASAAAKEADTSELEEYTWLEADSEALQDEMSELD